MSPPRQPFLTSTTCNVSGSAFSLARFISESAEIRPLQHQRHYLNRPRV